MSKYSPLKITLGCLLAAGLAFLSPYALAFGIAPGIMIVPVVICFLMAWSGPASAALATVGVLAMGLRVGGLFFGALCLVTEISPAWCSIQLLRKRVSMPRLVGYSMLFQLSANLLGVIMLRLNLGADMISDGLALLRTGVERLPALSVDSLLRQMYQLGLFGNASGVDISRAILTVEDRATLLDSWFQLMQANLYLTLPSSVINSAVLSGLIMAVLPSWICARRGDTPQVSYMGLHQWNLPVQAVKGLLFCLLVSAVLYFMGMSGSSPMVYATLQLVNLGFTIQGMASLSRMMRTHGMRPGTRALALGLLVLLARMVLVALGLVDSLMGPKGLFMDMARKRMDKDNNREDDER